MDNIEVGRILQAFQALPPCAAPWEFSGWAWSRPVLKPGKYLSVTIREESNNGDIHYSWILYAYDSKDSLEGTSEGPLPAIMANVDAQLRSEGYVLDVPTPKP